MEVPQAFFLPVEPSYTAAARSQSSQSTYTYKSTMHRRSPGPRERPVEGANPEVDDFAAPDPLQAPQQIRLPLRPLPRISFAGSCAAIPFASFLYVAAALASGGALTAAFLLVNDPRAVTIAAVTIALSSMALLGSLIALLWSLQNRDTNAERLWSALLAGDYDTEEVFADGSFRGTVYTLRTPGVRFLMGDDLVSGSRLFVRPWAAELYDRVMLHRIARAGFRFSGALIRGTPGTGKSWWLQYCMLRLARDRPSQAVLFESVQLDTAWLLQPGGGVKAYKSYAKQGPGFYALQALDDPETTFLFDPYGSRSVEPTSYSAFCIVASSPNPGNYKGFGKNPGVAHFYAPGWELDDLLAFRPFAAPQLSPEEIVNRFEHLGGVSRAVFALDRSVFENDLIAAAQSETLESLFRTVSRREPVGRNAPSHKLLHRLVEVAGERAYKDYSMVFASKWAANLVMERHITDEHDTLVAVATGARDLGKQLRGRAYKAVCRGQLQAMRYLDLSELPTRQARQIRTSDYDAITQPVDPNEVVDMVTVRRSGVSTGPILLLFNFTIDRQHGIKSKRLNDLVGGLLVRYADRLAVGAVAQVLYVWVVPRDVAPLFTLQCKTPATGPNIDQRVCQMLQVLDPRASF